MNAILLALILVLAVGDWGKCLARNLLERF